MNLRGVLSNWELFAGSPKAVPRLRELILQLAVQGKLVPQDAKDEPASVLLKKIKTEKERLVKEGKIKRDKSSEAIKDADFPENLPHGWAWSNLVTVGLVNPRNDATDDTPASFVQMSSIPVAFTEPHVTEDRLWRDIKSGFTQFAEGDVGVAKITPCFENGKSTVFRNLASGIGAGTTELHVVRPLCGIEPQYVLLFLKTPAFLREGEAGMTGSAGQKRLPRSYFETKPLPLPPLAEQSRIVTRVQELMQLCDALEAKVKLETQQHDTLLRTLLATLTQSASSEDLAQNWQRVSDHFPLLLDRPQAIDALEQTILQLAVRGLLVPQDTADEPASQLLKKIRAEKDKLIANGKMKRDKLLPLSAQINAPIDLPAGWSFVSLNELGDFRSGKTPNTGTPRYWGGSIPWISSKDMKSPVIVGSEDHITQAALDDGLAIVPERSILIVVRSGILRRTLPVAVTAVPVTVNQDLKALVLVRKDLAEYLHLLLRGWEQFILVNLTKVGTTVESVRFDDFAAFPFPLPPLPEQHRIVIRVTELRQLCAALRSRLAQSSQIQAQLAQALVSQAG